MSKEFQSCGASVIVYKDNKVLLQQRRDNGCWGYPGGHTELGEKVEDTARRELFEETGLKVLSMKLFDVFSGPELRHVYPDGNIVHIIDVVYISTEFEGELKLQKSEVLDLKWFDINDIPDNISPPVKPGLNKFIKQIQEVL